MRTPSRSLAYGAGVNSSLEALAVDGCQIVEQGIQREMSYLAMLLIIPTSSIFLDLF